MNNLEALGYIIGFSFSVVILVFLSLFFLYYLGLEIISKVRAKFRF
jgi:hypothetical protein